MSADILIVDDEADIRNLVQGILEDEGYSTREAKNSTEVYEMVKGRIPSLVILDIWLQGSQDDGLEILKKLKTQYPFMPVVMISGHGTIETAVSAIRDGAYDFVEKPFKSDRLLLMIRRALENAKLLRENAALKRQALGQWAELIGASAQIQQIQQVLERVAPTNSRVLLSGEPGTGKDIVARLIHRNSTRADEPFMVMNCATLRPERFEAELFGIEQGVRDESEKVGILEQAHGGTLLLDEVSDMPLETQGKIVRILQEQRFNKVGGTRPIEVDVRVLATTNRNLEELMKEGHFRQDLYYRLNVVPIQMPSLRERISDIQELANFFLQSFLQQSGLPARMFNDAAYALLKVHKWPGNIRQLRNVIEWVVIMNGSQNVDEFGPEHLPPEFNSEYRPSNIRPISDANGASASSYSELPLRDAREAFEREYLLSQVERFEGNISKTAQFVGMERSALHRKLKSLQIGSEKDETASSEELRKRASL
jgi:two-component system nitrogen regulation response regulator NtrX